MGNMAFTGVMFLEYAADGMFTRKLIKFIIKTGYYKKGSKSFRRK